MISQGGNGNFYFANSMGLLEYNGEKWSLYPIPNKTIVRSVKAYQNQIYTGAYMEMGYWTRNEFGKLVYTSLLPDLRDKINDGEQFWQIDELNGMIVFRSFDGIYFYSPKLDKLTKMENPSGEPISHMYKFRGNLYYQLVNKGLFKINSGKSELVIPNSKLGGMAIIGLFEKDGHLSFISGKDQFFKWADNELISIYDDLPEKMNHPGIISMASLRNGDLIIGTVGKGIFQIDRNGNIINVFNQENVLLNNTVLNIFEDKDSNVWAGLDYGISMINLNSRFSSFQDTRGSIGSVYTSFEQEGNLYLGTNQGLYFRKKGETNFNLIEGTNGQVWSLDEVDGKLFCGHDTGTFLIKDTKAIKVCDRLGTWVVKKFYDSTYVQGHYNGISFLQEKNGQIIALPMLEGFPHSSKFIEIDDSGDVWISNEHKGVFRMRINDSLTKYDEIKNYSFPNESGITSSIFKFNDTLYYSSKERVYKYNPESDEFSVNNNINKSLAGIKRVSGRMIVDDANHLWGFAEDGIFYIYPAPLTANYELEFVYIDLANRNITVGYENIEHINDNDYLIGVANGYLKFNKEEDLEKDYTISIDKINASILDSVSEPVRLGSTPNFSARKNNIVFQYSVPVYNKFQEVSYSYRLIGLSSNWSGWEHQSSAIFKNLPFGHYRFEVKAKVGNKISNISGFEFDIARPYYLSNLAILTYVIILILLFLATHLMYKRQHAKLIAENERKIKLKHLEIEKEIIKLKNEKLEQDMANKNKELAVSTMSLIKKNEFLTSIKNQLKNKEETQEIKSVIKNIDKDINEEDNWKFFKKAFSNADKDFFKKMKEKHPELTSNDLKLCAYLRLNLSSKEIAPLLNISVKSVEIKRYRLRKKMDLDRNTNLTDYIINV
ncbi:histidine kinase [Christiangramia fulva]|uniref:Histidine kinase n=2 Tax=Christiangramia fulva TaxID=2126553 RepID=A0A2R3ZAY1_9FLAO|nr:histidine kinase [Christiangramia fulva]